VGALLFLRFSVVAGGLLKSVLETFDADRDGLSFMRARITESN
jgi:hypothetical protein